MKKLYFTKGLPASSKSTWAKAKQAELGTNKVKIVNKDNLRLLLDNREWSKGNEKFVIKVRDAIIDQALSNGYSVIVDDTNLAPIHEETCRRIANYHNAEFEIVDFTNVPLEECVRRDQRRPNYCGESVIRKMYNDYLRPVVEPAPVVKGLPYCVISDLDGSLFTMKDRGPFEWDKVYNDDPRLIVADAVLGAALHGGDQVILFSGRDEVCRDETVRALKDKLGFNFPLYMRPKGDMRSDVIIKNEMYNDNILGKFNVRAVFDDRQKVCRDVWAKLGLKDRLFRVGPIDEDDF